MSTNSREQKGNRMNRLNMKISGIFSPHRISPRRISVAAFSFSFAYLLSFLFEGQVLYSLLDLHGMSASSYILAAIIAHFFGLLTCGLLIRSRVAAKGLMIVGMGVCLATTVPFFFSPCALWMVGLIAGGYFCGCTVAAWGYFLRAFTPKNERIKVCADVLIYSNLLMIAINVVALNKSPYTGLVLSMLCLIIGMLFILALPAERRAEHTKEQTEEHSKERPMRRFVEHWMERPMGPRVEKPLRRQAEQSAQVQLEQEQVQLEQEERQNKASENTTPGGVRDSLLLLCLFVFIITINSGLMYQVINPAFAHLSWLTSWYWAVPYILALAIMCNLSAKAKRSRILYVGMAMIMGAFISFMLLGRDTLDYLIVDTLMLGACGIFDLFWWSILGEMLDYSKNPSLTFGAGLSANVLGVLMGDILGMGVRNIGLPGAEVAVIALTVVCVTLVMLPPLNRQLILLLRSHTYLAAYDNMSQSQQTDIVRQIKTLDPLTAREQEVLQEILSGKSNREIAKVLFISENTVKTHARSIFSKYDVGSRAELISLLLKNQAVE